MDYQPVLQQIQTQCTGILRGNLVGIYVHGSIAFQCFRWDNSDIDFIIVVHSRLTHETKRELMDAIFAINQTAPPNGLEMSVVLREYCERFQYPTPYELHYSNGHREWFQNNPGEYCQKMNGTDPDLAAHFTIIRKTGVVLCGAPIASVFGGVPREYYLDSIQLDIKNAKDDIQDSPVYIILNLCRVLAYVQNGLILSKAQGGQWGLSHVNPAHHGLIAQALGCYRSDKPINIDTEDTHAFCDEMLRLIFDTMP